MFRSLLRIVSLMAFLLSLQACVAGTRLETTNTGPEMVQGNFDVYLYGCRYPSQPDNVAILISKKAAYNFEIFDIDSSFKVQNDVAAEEALRAADRFVRCSTYSVWMTQLRRIVDPAGNTFGYELRPLYVPLEFGMLDIMNISYSLRNSKVSAYIRLDREVDRILSAPGDDQASARGRHR